MIASLKWQLPPNSFKCETLFFLCTGRHSASIAVLAHPSGWLSSATRETPRSPDVRAVCQPPPGRVPHWTGVRLGLRAQRHNIHIDTHYAQCPTGEQVIPNISRISPRSEGRSCFQKRVVTTGLKNSECCCGMLLRSVHTIRTDIILYYRI